MADNEMLTTSQRNTIELNRQLALERRVRKRLDFTCEFDGFQIQKPQCYETQEKKRRHIITSPKIKKQCVSQTQQTQQNKSIGKKVDENSQNMFAPSLRESTMEVRPQPDDMWWLDAASQIEKLPGMGEDSPSRNVVLSNQSPTSSDLWFDVEISHFPEHHTSVTTEEKELINSQQSHDLSWIDVVSQISTLPGMTFVSPDQSPITQSPCHDASSKENAPEGNNTSTHPNTSDFHVKTAKTQFNVEHPETLNPSGYQAQEMYPQLMEPDLGMNTCNDKQKTKPTITLNSTSESKQDFAYSHLIMLSLVAEGKISIESYAEMFGQENIKELSYFESPTIVEIAGVLMDVDKLQMVAEFQTQVNHRVSMKAAQSYFARWCDNMTNKLTQHAQNSSDSGKCKPINPIVITCTHEDIQVILFNAMRRLKIPLFPIFQNWISLSDMVSQHFELTIPPANRLVLTNLVTFEEDSVPKLHHKTDWSCHCNTRIHSSDGEKQKENWTYCGMNLAGMVQRAIIEGKTPGNALKQCHTMVRVTIQLLKHGKKFIPADKHTLRQPHSEEQTSKNEIFSSEESISDSMHSPSQPLEMPKPKSRKPKKFRQLSFRKPMRKAKRKWQ